MYIVIAAKTINYRRSDTSRVPGFMKQSVSSNKLEDNLLTKFSFSENQKFHNICRLMKSLAEFIDFIIQLKLGDRTNVSNPRFHFFQDVNIRMYRPVI